MVLMHGKSPEGRRRSPPAGRKPEGAADRLRPDWTKHAKAAPFQRNDAMLAIMPIGVLEPNLPGTGIRDNLADKARKLGIPVYRFRIGGA